MRAIKNCLGSLNLPLFLALAAFTLGLAGCSDDAADVSCSDLASSISTPGVISTWAGNGTPGFNGDSKCITESALYWPIDLTFAPGGDTYVLDWNNHAVRIVTPEGKFKVVVGTPEGVIPFGDGPFPGSGYDDLNPPGAPGTEVSLNHPTDIAPLPDGRMLLASWHNHKLRTYDPATGLVLVVCGSEPGYAGDGGPAVDAQVSQPSQVIVAENGDIYILDQRNQRVRRIDSSGIINTVAGSGTKGFAGDGGDPLLAQFAFHDGGNPTTSGSITFDAQGRLYISDTGNHRIRRVDLGANRIETIAGAGSAGFSGDGGPAVDAMLNEPRDVEIGPDGKLYVADEYNHRVRVIDLATGIISTVAGNGSAEFAGDGGPAVDASLNRPSGLAFDSLGNLYIADYNNHRIRKVNL